MGRYNILLICIFACLSYSIKARKFCRNDAGDIFYGGACFVTTQTLRTPFKPEELSQFSNDEQIKEWHFHVYFFQYNENSVTAANRLRKELLEKVQQKKLIAVFHGVSDEELPGLNTSNIPPVNMHPIGPHPAGSYEVWCPKEYFAEVLDFFIRRRGEISVLIHPLSRHKIQDHFTHNMWLGRPFNIDGTVLREDIGYAPLQYSELGLGYSVK